MSDPGVEVPLCVTCGTRRRERRKEKDYKNATYRPQCKKCRQPFGSRGPANGNRRNYRGRTDINLTSCIRCGFVAEDPCQIDIDHVDGDRHNNARENLQPLCANCHRLKTKQQGVIRPPASA